MEPFLHSKLGSGSSAKCTASRDSFLRSELGVGTEDWGLTLSPPPLSRSRSPSLPLSPPLSPLRKREWVQVGFGVWGVHRGGRVQGARVRRGVGYQIGFWGLTMGVRGWDA